MENIKKQVVANKTICRTTVVIPNYNGIKYIEACIASVFTGSVVPQIIVVDNASTDQSREFVAKEYAHSSNLTLISLPENTGFCHAVNVGIEAAETEFVLLLNNDTTIDKDCIRHLEAALDEDKRIFSVSAKMIDMYHPDKLDDAGDFYSALGWAFARGKDKSVAKYNKKDRIFSACAAGALYRRAVFDEIGLFDEAHFAYLEDMDIGYRANISGYQNHFVPDAILYHAGSGVSGSRHNPFKVDLSARNSVYLIYKNMPFLQVIINLPFLFAGYFIKFLFFARKKMGKTYIKGVMKGIKLSCSGEGRKKKIAFKWKNLPNYFWIQGQLWVSLVRRFFELCFL